MRRPIFMGDMTELKLAAKEADRCVACGLCLPSCPTYRKTGSEADSPRGRIQLINAVAQGRLTPSKRFSQHIDLCLTCRTCENVCPNGVGYGVLVDAARALIAPEIGLKQKIARWILRRHQRIAFAGRMLRLGEISGLRRVATQLQFLKPAAQILQNIPAQPTWEACYPAVQGKGEVALFLGCASSIMDPVTLRATIFVLNRLGYTVHVPSEQCCCGGIARQQGDTGASQDMLTQNKRAFAALGDMPIISAVSGCGMGLMDYMGNRVIDISAFLANADWQGVALTSLPATIHVHDACSLRNAMRQHKHVYDLLQHIPQADIQQLPGNDQCCGGAGSYMLTQPKMARQLRDDKMDVCKSTGARLLVTSNIGCALHIAAGLREDGMEIEVIHPIQLIARQMGFQTENT